MSGPRAVAKPPPISAPANAGRETLTLVLRAPLIPVALAATAGVLAERVADQPAMTRWNNLDELFLLLMGSAVLSTIAWGITWARGRLLLGLVLLWLATAFLGAAWHRQWRLPSADDLAHDCMEPARLVRVRGQILELRYELQPDAPLRSRPPQPQTVLLLRVTTGLLADAWQPRSGRVKVWIGGRRDGIAVSDEVELLGTLQRFRGPANPGQQDTVLYYRDQGVHALLEVKTPDAVELRAKGPTWSLAAAAGRVRAWGGAALDRHLAPDVARIARALVLGEQWELDARQFEAYQRTGVFHVLAVSGQHVVVLCGLLWLVLRFLHLPRRLQALFMIGLVLAYCLITGSRPPMVRAASIVVATCSAMLLARQAHPLNSLSLAWIITIVLNPTDMFQTGCQISYLAVLILWQCLGPWHRWSVQSRGALETLISESRPLWQQILLKCATWVWWTLLSSLVLTLALSPLLAARYHLIAPISVPLAPPMLLLTFVALLAGFLGLTVGPFVPFMQSVLFWIVERSLDCCGVLVEAAESLPLAYWYTAGLPEWLLWLFYGPLIAFLLLPPLHRRWKLGLIGAGVWLVLALVVQQGRMPESVLRCTVLSVGHGTCVVIETPDGRVLLYDAGSLDGPEVTHRHLAPFLWHRGITRIDEVLISHADLDHFNCLPALLDRFRVGQVTLTPTFSDRQEPAVRLVTGEMERREVPARVVTRGQRLAAGEVQIDVLHPPPRGPSGKENARSLVLLVSYSGHTLLLTGDLEEPGLSDVTAGARPRVDVLLAPHHGSRFSNTEAFANWAQPGLVVSSEGRPTGPRADPYTAQGATMWRTWHEGAVTIIMDQNGLRAETFRTQKQWRR